jgi:hypothetical protein
LYSETVAAGTPPLQEQVQEQVGIPQRRRVSAVDEEITTTRKRRIRGPLKQL